MIINQALLVASRNSFGAQAFALVMMIVLPILIGVVWGVYDLIRRRGENKRRQACRCPACDHDLNSVHIDERVCPNCGADVQSILADR